jgi:hypothetical protein
MAIASGTHFAERPDVFAAVVARLYTLSWYISIQEKPMSPQHLEIIKTTANVVTVMVALAAIFVSAYVAWITHRRAIIPILVFLFREDLWTVKNVGAGPALNLHIAWQEDTEGGHWKDLLRCYPLSPKEAIKLRHYPTSAMALAAVYTDAYGKKSYTSYCRDDLSTFSRADRYKWDMRSAKREWEIGVLDNARIIEN